MPNVFIDREKLTNLLNDFNALTQIRITFWDSEGVRCILGCADSCSEYCRELQKVPEFYQECLRSDEEALNYASRTPNQLYSFRCHAGMNEFVFPVVYDQTLLGHFMFGQVRVIDLPDDPRDRQMIYDKYRVDARAMQAKYETLPRLPLTHMHAAGRMLSTLASYAYLNGLVRRKRETVSERACEYIEAHYREPLTLERLCRHMHVSRSTLCHALKKERGQTFVELLNSCRIRNVKLQLLCGLGIGEAAFASGYMTENYMTRVFKRLEGITPSEFCLLNRAKQAR